MPFRSQCAIDQILLAALPWIVLAVNSDWIYSPSGTIDTWLYHAYFHKYPEFVSTLFPDVYYGTRLSWIVPGYIAYHLFPPFAANVVLHLAVWYAAVFALYGAVTLLADRGAALVAAVSFGTVVPTLVALGWDYVDGAIIAYVNLTLWATLKSLAQPGGWRFAMLAGTAGAAAVHANLGAAMILPVVAIAYLTLRQWHGPQIRLRRDTVAFVAGFLGLTALMCAINAAVGGPFFFFLSSVTWLATHVGTTTYQYTPPLAWPGAARLILPVIGVVAAIGALARGVNGKCRFAAYALGWMLIAFGIYDAAFDGALFQTQYYVSWLLPFVFVAVGVALPRGLSRTNAFTAVISALVLHAMALTAVPERLMDLAHDRFGADLSWWRFTVLAACVLSVAGAVARARSGRQAVIVVIALAAANMIAGSRLPFSPDPCAASQFDAVQQTLQFIRERVPEGRKPLFWIASGPNAAFYHSLASTHLYLYSLVGADYPRLPDDATTSPRFGASLRPGTIVVIISDSQPNPDVVAREFERFTLKTVIRHSELMQTEFVRFFATIVDIPAGD